MRTESPAFDVVFNHDGFGMLAELAETRMTRGSSPCSWFGGMRS